MTGCGCWAQRAPSGRPRALEHAAELFERADTDGDGVLTLVELQRIMQTAGQQYSHLTEHARFLAGWVRTPLPAVQKAACCVCARPGQSHCGAAQSHAACHTGLSPAP